MKKKTIMKILLDVVMTGVLVLLYNSHVFALAFHEIAGLILGGMFIVHCLLNGKWISSITGRFFGKGLAPRVRVGYIINFLLFVVFTAVIISGILTSQVLFPAATEKKDSIWRGIHHFSAALSIILVGVHLGLHWGFIAGMWKKAVRMPGQIAKPISLCLLAIILAFGCYSAATSSFGSWLAEPFAAAQVRENPTAAESEKIGDETQHRPKAGERKDGAEHAGSDDSTHPAGEKKSVEGNPMMVAHTAATFLSMLGVFAALAYYIDKYLRKRRT